MSINMLNFHANVFPETTCRSKNIFMSVNITRQAVYEKLFVDLCTRLGIIRLIARVAMQSI